MATLNLTSNEIDALRMILAKVDQAEKKKVSKADQRKAQDEQNQATAKFLMAKHLNKK